MADAPETVSPWSHVDLVSAAVSTRQIIDFLQANASAAFLERHDLSGNAETLAKNKKKPALVMIFEELFELKEFRDDAKPAEEAPAAAPDNETVEPCAEGAEAPVADECAAGPSGPAPTRPWTDEEMLTEAVTKRAIVDWLQANGTLELLEKHKCAGAPDSAAKNRKKPELVACVSELYAGSGAWREPGSELHKPKPAVAKAPAAKAKAPAPAEPVKYTKTVTKKGDAANKPRKGDNVHVWYTGKLADGSVFDTNTTRARGAKPQPLVFKVGVGKVIRGWDEALLTMGVGECATITIDPEWAYGKKGKSPLIPPNAALTFDVELVKIGK